MFLLRYAVTDPVQLLLGTSRDRTLSCNLNVAWPGKARPDAHDDALVAILSKVFAPLPKKTRAIGSQANAEEGRFVGWLSYATEDQVKDGLQALHKALLAAGLGMDQWTREMILPRDNS
jgi:hypothetical protein